VHHELTVRSRGTIADKQARDASTSMPTGGAVNRLAIGRGIAAPLTGALTAATNELLLDLVADVAADGDAFYRSARQHTSVQPAHA
jgi:hypothetical protein